jgi:hypothetical protein
MRTFRFKCGRCGLEATRVCGGDRGVTSVNVDEFRSRCALAAEVAAQGLLADPREVDCPHLKAAAVAEESAKTTR